MGSANGSGRDNDRDTTSRAGGGILTLAGVPIGRPEDAPPRLAAELATADVVAAEDTRRVRQLAAALNVTIGGRVISYYDVIETRRAEQLAAELAAGKNVLVVTDAGMPGISDPGYRVVAAAVAAGIRVTAVPGPSAVTTALAVSGLPTDRFCFEGFPPRKPGERERRFAELAAEPRTQVFFESPRRVDRDPGGAAGLARRRPGRGRLPGADQDPRGDRAGLAGRARRLGGGQGPGVRGRPGRDHAGCGRRWPGRREGRRPGFCAGGAPRRPIRRPRRRPRGRLRAAAGRRRREDDGRRLTSRRRPTRPGCSPRARRPNAIAAARQANGTAVVTYR